MGMFVFGKKKDSTQKGDIPVTADVDGTNQNITDSDVPISWDTLSFGDGGGTQEGEIPYIQEKKILTRNDDKRPDENTSERADVGRRNPDIDAQVTPIDYSKYVFPKIDLLSVIALSDRKDDDVYKEKLEAVFQSYKVKAEIMNISQTDIAVTFAIKPNQGVRINSVTSYKEEYELALGGRIEYEIPLKGTSYLGIHVLKENKSKVGFRKIIESEEYKDTKARIPLIMGALTSGKPVIEDLDAIGHLLIGGETGSGKSVFLNSLILGILYMCSPADVQFIFVDTNVLNLSVYNQIPSLLLPVITDARRGIAALSWCASEINRRTKIMSNNSCKDIDDYNKKPKVIRLPHIVLVIDEFAPLIESDEGLEALLALTTVGKAAGVHMVLSTQKVSSRSALRRIKECIHARIAFSIFSEMESKVLLDVPGAEKLSGSGDMLYRKPGQNTLIRIQGANVKDEDVTKTVEYIKENNSYHTSEELGIIPQEKPEEHYDASMYDELIREAGMFVIDKQKASIGMLQRTFKLGFNRCARIMDELGELGVVGPEEDTRPRTILMNMNEFENLMDQLGL